MVRSEWLSLNGLWEFALTRAEGGPPARFAESILVPFPVESALSGIRRPVNEKMRLWYRRTFTVPAGWRGRRVLLNFEAVDWEARVRLNGRELGTHRGGYDRFSFDITEALNPEGEQELVVSVFDPGDRSHQPRGKQMVEARLPFFTAASGIWQTVWLEPVGEVSVESLRIVPDVDGGALVLETFTRGESDGVTVEAVVLDGRSEVVRGSAAAGEELRLAIPEARLWSPDDPFLYDLKVSLLRDGEVLDSVSSYFGMRKISVITGEDGIPRLALNNEPLFQFGPLDQGYWPDGIYTASTDEALRSDIERMKELGFNLCCKHVKVEPERWYYWCDRLGLLVWQDMPNGDQTASRATREITRSAESAANSRRSYVGSSPDGVIIRAW